MGVFTFYQNVWLFLSLLSNFILSVFCLNQVILVFSYVLSFLFFQSTSLLIVYWLRYLSCKCIYWFFFSVQGWHCLLTIDFSWCTFIVFTTFWFIYILFIFVPLLGFYFLSFHDFLLIMILFKISLLYSIPPAPPLLSTVIVILCLFLFQGLL